MKPSVPWLLLSSAITLPITFEANTLETIDLQTPSTSQSLGTNDSYQGATTPTTAFSYKNTSSPNGTSYSLTGDVSFINVSSTQSPTLSNVQPGHNDGHSHTSLVTPRAYSVSMLTEDPENQVITQNSPVNINLTTTDSYPQAGQNTQPFLRRNTTAQSGTTYTLANDVGFQNITATQTSPASTSQQTPASNIHSFTKPLGISISSTPISTTTTSTTTSTGNGETNKSCFSNTAGPLSFVGNGHSLLFQNISITPQGSAINNTATSLTFSGFSLLSFDKATNQTQSSADSAIFIGTTTNGVMKQSEQPSASFTISSNTDVNFSGNHSKGAGGAILVKGNGTISGNTGTVIFSGNSATNQGGALSLEKSLNITDNAQVIFTNNSAATVSDKKSVKEGNGNQASTGLGGAIYCLAASPEQNVQTLDETNEIAVSFSGNKTLYLVNNSATTSGGAIHTKNLSLTSGGQTIFGCNSSSKGGAIFITDGGKLNLTALDGPITFRGNTITTSTTKTEVLNNDSSTNTVTANAITLGNGATITNLRAATGQSLQFFDPIVEVSTPSKEKTKIKAVQKAILQINALDDTTDTHHPDSSSSVVYDGTVLFSGENVDNSRAENVTSVIYQPVSLNNGTLWLKSGAILEVDSFIQNPNSLLVMDVGTTLKTHNTPIQKQSVESEEQAEQESSSAKQNSNEETKVNAQISHRLSSTHRKEQLRVGSSIRDKIISVVSETLSSLHPEVAVHTEDNATTDGNITITNLGINLNSLGRGENESITITGGSSGTVKLTGDLQLFNGNNDAYDSSIFSKGFSTDILKITTEGSSETGTVDLSEFNPYLLGATSANYGYQGTWSLQRVEKNGQSSFEMVWKAAGYKPGPELSALLVPNSLWCATVDVNSIERLMELTGETNNNQQGLWVSGISNFFHRDAMLHRLGFRHISAGYSIGANSQTSTDNVFNIAFCQMFGKTKNYFLSNTKSHLYAGSIYTKHSKTIRIYGFELPAIVNTHLSYGTIHNKMVTDYPAISSARGVWDNHCLSGEIGFSLALNPMNIIFNRVSTFAKVHAVYVNQESFNETGAGEKCRHFRSSHLVNLTLPLGIKIKSNEDPDNKTYALTLAYHPDVYRVLPQSHVALPAKETSWSSPGTNLARQAFLAELSCYQRAFTHLELFANGSCELRSSSRNYNVDVGGKYKF
ncbi:autotransporter beta-domain protein [Chlamydia ibidis]|uniref:Autotransporter beta-domain protein n=2 Tax=Chlamydia ibidis TaxID=1405396 RepID=S7J2Z6_9CHLA|nr:polymorphic outer membrane protein middle domain-containing protein [Chlamydia ibidis]EPP34397.1 autotransporter beta-domain protein [Chlamydia ibidis]EQM62887.1 autotransporter beta-domain protein [Chlamydia ibidis 10-1398/6]